MEVDGVIRVYVCPKKGCKSYYGSSEMPKLEEQWNTDLKNEPTTLRSTCPNCGSQRQERWAWLIPQDHVQEVLRAAGIPTKRKRPLRPVA